MKTIKIFFICTIMCAKLLDVSGENSYVFHHLTTGDGMSNNSVKSLLRDSQGFLWIGTELGLNRYDGYSFKTFLATPGLKNQLTTNNILGLAEDGFENIWVYTGYSYLVYNREKENFITDIHQVLNKLSIKANDNCRIYVGKNKNLFVVNSNNINYYDVRRKILRVFKTPNLSLGSIEITDDLNNLYVNDANGTFWQVNKKFGKLNKILLPKEGDSNYSTKHIKIFADSKGGLWLFYGKDDFVYYRQVGSSLWKKIYLTSSIKSQNTITSIVEGNNNQIWIATDHKGLFVYNKSDGVLLNVVSNSLAQTSIASNNVTSILIDNMGTVWVGHDKKGVSYFNKTFQNFVNMQNGQCRDISRIYELRNGNLLLGTDGNGLYIKDNNQQNVKKLPIPNTAIVSLLEDKKGRVWVGTYQQGLYRIDHNSLKNFTTNNSNLSSDNIWGLNEDKYGNIWIGTLGGKIQKYPSNNSSNHFEAPFSDTQFVSDMIYDGDKTIYVATVFGLTCIDIKTNSRQILLGNKKGTQQFNQQLIFNVYKDSRGLLWLGTNAGLTIWNLKKDSLRYFDKSNGLCDNIITGITEDNFKNVWVTTSNGLSVLTIEDKNNNIQIANSKNFSIKDGLQSDYFNNHSICRLRNGSILVGTTEGYTVIDPEKVTERRQSLSKVYFTGITIGNTQIHVDSVYKGHVILNKSIGQIQELNLKYNDKLITLEFTTNDLINANKVKYLYKIEDFNNQWISTPKNEINITSLPTGKYKLLIKACNSDGVWNNETKALLINIAPPFYYSSWAITIYALLILGLVLFVIYRIKRRHNIKLEQQRIHMVHEQETMISEMKLRFFTNISHDLRTPLTLIITPLQTLLKEINDEGLKKKLDVMFKNAQQLLSLINSLLDFRKLDVGAEIIHLRSGNIVELVNEIYSSFEVYATDRKVNFILNKSIDSLWLEYDHDKIIKCVANLLSNAFKYTPNGGVVKLSLYTDESDVCISISDNGIGISDEDKEFVFNRFYQTTQNARTTGSGIGLHIVSEYIKLHNGSIKLIDNKPSGCVFTLRFPRIESASVLDGDSEEFSGEVSNVHYESNFQTKPVILFVDDNQDLCEFINDNLKNEYSIFIANDGQEAITLLNQNDINIVVSDVMMPVMDGIELCKQIKANIYWSHIPVILLTARTAEEHKVEGLELGADDYITKPFNLDILKLRILKFIEWSRKSHSIFKQKLEINPHEITITSLDEKLLEKAIAVVENHVSDTEFGVETLGDALGLSRGHLYKKLIAITGRGPAEFIRTIRLKRAMQLLEKSQMQIAEIAYEVGFNSPKRFSINFKEEFGLSPSEFLRKVKNDKQIDT